MNCLLTCFCVGHRGFSGEHVKEYIESSNPSFAIGEYWDSLAYNGGDLCYNQGNLQIHFPKIRSTYRRDTEKNI